jgi:hypothetical protein
MNGEQFEMRKLIFEHLPLDILYDVQAKVDEEIERLNRDAAFIGRAILLKTEGEQ